MSLHEQVDAIDTISTVIICQLCTLDSARISSQQPAATGLACPGRRQFKHHTTWHPRRRTPPAQACICRVTRVTILTTSVKTPESYTARRRNPPRGA